MPHSNAALQQEGSDLIDNASALADQTLTHAVQRLLNLKTAKALDLAVPPSLVAAAVEMFE